MFKCTQDLFHIFIFSNDLIFIICALCVPNNQVQTQSYVNVYTQRIITYKSIIHFNALLMCARARIKHFCTIGWFILAFSSLLLVFSFFFFSLSLFISIYFYHNNDEKKKHTELASNRFDERTNDVNRPYKRICWMNENSDEFSTLFYKQHKQLKTT